MPLPPPFALIPLSPTQLLLLSQHPNQGSPPVASPLVPQDQTLVSLTGIYTLTYWSIFPMKARYHSTWHILICTWTSHRFGYNGGSDSDQGRGWRVCISNKSPGYANVSPKVERLWISSPYSSCMELRERGWEGRLIEGIKRNFCLHRSRTLFSGAAICPA